MNKRIMITGALSYSGRYIAELAREQGWDVHALEGVRSAGKPNPHAIPITLFDWEQPVQQGRVEQALRGCDVLVNTYWRRPTEGEDATAIAQQHSLDLFAAAKEAGVGRVIHLSVAHADEDSDLPYFRRKGRVERALRELAIPCSVLRPAMLFGDSAEESILINNWAWCLRHSPVAGLMGDGHAEIQPIHVRDLADMVMSEAARVDGAGAPWNAYAAVGRECLSLRDVTERLIAAMRLRYRCVLPIPVMIASMSSQMLARLMGGVRLFEKEEIQSLMEGKLAYTHGLAPEEERWQGAPPVHSFSAWLREQGEQLGRKLI